MSCIKLVLWDLDGTLIDNLLPERYAISKCFEDFNLGECPVAFLDDYPAVNMKWWDRLGKNGITKERLIVGRFEEMLSRFGYDQTLARKFNENYMMHLSDTVSVIPGAVEVLSSLKGRVVQAIATNGVTRTQSRKIRNAGFDKLVDFVYISEDVGTDKPDVEFFDSILGNFSDLKRDEVMIVGDSPSTDMAGGNNAGIVCCWFNPTGRKRDFPFRIDYEISELKDVSEVIK